MMCEFVCGKKKYTEKDFYVSISNNLCRMYVNKEKGQGHIWKDPPKNWDEKWGPWRSPTGKSKDTLPELKKKCDFLLENMPIEKQEKVNEIRHLIDIVRKDNKQFHNIVTCLLLRDILTKAKENFKMQTVSTEKCSLNQEVIDILDDIKDIMVSEPTSNRKRSSDNRIHMKSTVKKPKCDRGSISNQKISNVGNTSCNFQPILPKPSILPSLDIKNHFNQTQSTLIDPPSESLNFEPHIFQIPSVNTDSGISLAESDNEHFQNDLLFDNDFLSESPIKDDINLFDSSDPNSQLHWTKQDRTELESEKNPDLLRQRLERIDNDEQNFGIFV